MRCCSLIVLVLCSATLAGAGGGEKKGDKLDGTWAPVSTEVGGRKVPEDKLAGLKLVIEGNRFTIQDGKVTIKGTFKADPSKTPRTIDAEFEAEKGKKVTLLMIYELKGDTLRVCGAEPGKPRPTAFKTAKDDGRELTVYKRQK
jgi:uncharacterized protein (TIGR03067 family)